MNFCTLLDSSYLLKGLAVYRSLRTHAPSAKLYVLALDGAVASAFDRLENAYVVPLSFLERGVPELLSIKQERTPQEMAWTLASVFTWKCLQSIQNLYGEEHLAYLDADTFFFDNPGKVYEHYTQFSVALTPHRFAEKDKHREKTNGFYNVNWVQVNRYGLPFLEEWANSAMAWCYNRNDGGLFGDQGILNTLGPKYRAVDITEVGINVAPWNQLQYNYELRDGKILVSGEPLVLFHFHELLHNKHRVVTRRTNWQLHSFVSEHIYPIYEKALAEAEHELLAR